MHQDLALQLGKTIEDINRKDFWCWERQLYIQMDCTAWNVNDIKVSKRRIGPFKCSSHQNHLVKGSKPPRHFYIRLSSSGLKSVCSLCLTHAPFSYLKILGHSTNRVP